MHRLWEPLAAKRRPANAYAAKFSQPYCIAAGLRARARRARRVHRGARARGAPARARGEGALRDRPEQPLPERVHRAHPRPLADGTEVEERQPHMRGGAHEPLSRADLEAKFRLNCAYGGWPPERAAAVPRLRVAGVRRRDRPRALSRLADVKELAGRVALVTGAGRNIGRAIALALADGRRRGGGQCAPVAGRGRRALRREIEAAGGRALAVLADVTDPAAVARMVDGGGGALRPHRHPRQQRRGARRRPRSKRSTSRAGARSPA